MRRSGFTIPAVADRTRRTRWTGLPFCMMATAVTLDHTVQRTRLAEEPQWPSTLPMAAVCGSSAVSPVEPTPIARPMAGEPGSAKCVGEFWIARILDTAGAADQRQVNPGRRD